MSKKQHKHCPECGAEIPIKDGKTYISVVIDESGSMEERKKDTIAGFNSYISKLKEQGINGLVTLTKFNSVSGANIVYKNRPVNEVPKLNSDTYRPDNSTPLYDAVGTTIQSLDESCSDKVIMVIITDGLENASCSFTQKRVREMIESRQSKGWTFVYLGANQDSWATGGAMGIYGTTISNYDTIHTRHLYGAAATMTYSYAATGNIGATAADAVADAISDDNT